MRRTARTTARSWVVAGVALAALCAVGTPAVASTVPVGPDAGTGTAPAPLPSGPPDPALAAAVAAWVAGDGEADLETLAEDFTALEQAAAAAAMHDMATDCVNLGADVAAAQRHAPIPDGPAQQHWAATLTLYRLGAGDCVSGATRGDPALLNRASDEIIQGSDELQKVSDRLTEIG